MKNTTDVLDHFSSKGSEWGDLYQNPHFKDRLDLFVGAVDDNLSKGSRILDFGCGAGDISIKLAQNGYRVNGVDGAPGMVESATKRTPAELADNVSFAHLTFPSESWFDSEFDGIVCSSVIEYVPDDDELLRKLSAALLPKGILIISIPHSFSLLNLAEDTLSFIKKISSSKSADRNFAKRRYSLTDFNTKLSNAGLKYRSHKNFEFPRLGNLGVSLSRMRIFSLMTIVIAEKI